MDELKALPVWLLWKREMRKTRDGVMGPTKVPYKVDGTFARNNDPSTWCTFKEAQMAMDSGKFDGIGIVFEKSAGIVGIDLDHCVENEEVDDDMLELLEEANTYVEYSPSRTGLHLLFRTEEKIELLANKHIFDATTKKAIEGYTWGRYFTFTEDEARFSKPLRTVTADEFRSLLALKGYPWNREKILKNRVDYTAVRKVDLSDEEVLEKMFRSKNGEKAERLWGGDLKDNNNDPSAADMALCCHLAFWTQKRYDQIERMWLASPLGAREKTQKRADYREMTISKALEVTSEVYSPKAKTNEDGREIDYGFIEVERGSGNNKKMMPVLSTLNLSKIVRKHPELAGKFRLNDYSHMVESCFLRQEWVILNDPTIFKTLEIISKEFPFAYTASKSMVTDAILLAANDLIVNPPKDYFSSLVWDKVPRLDTWMTVAYGVEDNELHRAIGSNWIKGLVKRVMFPGCQFDEVLALESPQGWKKSSSIRELGRPWHVETTHSMDNKDFYLLVAQNVIVEFAEGEIFDRASINKLKAEVTKIEDQVRPPYERGIQKFKRACVFAITTNKLELKDDTGNRRWLPVELQKPADVDWIIENRDQLFAEAFYRVVIKRESTWEYPTESLQEIQQSREEEGDYDVDIIQYCASVRRDRMQEEGISIKEVFDHLFKTDEGKTMKEITRLHQLTVAACLRKRLFMTKRVVRIGGIQQKRWMPTDKTMKVFDGIDNAGADKYPDPIPEGWGELIDEFD